jgi:hypothetical protein
MPTHRPAERLFSQSAQIFEPKNGTEVQINSPEIDRLGQRQRDVAA